MQDTDMKLMDSLDYDQREWVRESGLGDIHSEEAFFKSLSEEQLLLIKISIVEEATNSLHDKGLLEPMGMDASGEISWAPTERAKEVMKSGNYQIVEDDD